MQDLDFITAYESNPNRGFCEPAYWNETEVETSALGILAAVVWELFVGTWCGLAVWKMQS